MREQGEGRGRVDELTRAASRSFLIERLDSARGLGEHFPERLASLPGWIDRQNEDAARAYRTYLDERQAGAPRRFFTNRSHALHFLRAVAPTKLVDGAWLYGLLAHWDDARLGALVRIYLDELGRGRPAQNHVVLYRELLARHGLDTAPALGDAQHTQGAVQLALAHHAEEFLPELIGFNLGYEQLPLHLPISAYELAELGIDPYYFTLHVTVDNAGSGHARQALDAVFAAAPRLGGGDAFLARVATGYHLNAVGMGSVEAIESFDLERELLAMLTAKAAVGAALHSDHCRVGGRTVTEWLREPDRLPDFLRTLEGLGWIRHGRPPQESRFWRLLHDEGAPMFGAFSAWEQTLLADWISGPAESPAAGERPAVRRFRAGATAAPNERPVPVDATTAEVIRHHLADSAHGSFDPDLQTLVDALAAVDERSAAMAVLTGFLSPALHATPVGLLATRLFADLFDLHG